MNKNFTKEDILKKQETNIKSAVSAFSLAGILGIIYIVRYIITGNFDFYFSLSIPEIMLRTAHDNPAASPVAYTVTALFLLTYLVTAILLAKSPRRLPLALMVYGADLVTLLSYIFIFKGIGSVGSEIFIEVIIHFFVILFLIVGIRSLKPYYASREKK